MDPREGSSPRIVVMCDNDRLQVGPGVGQWKCLKFAVQFDPPNLVGCRGNKCWDACHQQRGNGRHSIGSSLALLCPLNGIIASSRVFSQPLKRRISIKINTLLNLIDSLLNSPL